MTSSLILRHLIPMPNILTSSHGSPTLEEVHLRFIEWRQTRHNQELIPYALRMDVASLLDHYSRTIIIQTLSLTSSQLKDICAIKKYMDDPSPPSAATQTFIQMPSLPTSPSALASPPVETDAAPSLQTPSTPIEASASLITLTLTNQHDLTFQTHVNQTQALLFLKTFINESILPCSN